jgi:hypothetical protein
MGESGKNTGVPYERLVQAIFQAIHDQDQVNNVTIERDKTLQGKISTHQIDVHWQFEKGGITYETIVQAKDWQNVVKQGELFHFKCILDDLPRQPRGVFVTRTGYQQGAKDFAAAQGIILYELDELPKPPGIVLTTLGWARYEAQLRSFKIQAKNPDEKPVEELALGHSVTIFEPRHSTLRFQIDPAWLAANPSSGLTDQSSVTLAAKHLLDITLYDSNQAPIGNMETVVREECAIIRDQELKSKHVERVFATDTFLGPEYTENGFVKIKNVSFDVEVEQKYRPAHFNLTKFVQLVLRESLSDKTRTFLGPKETFPS